MSPELTEPASVDEWIEYLREHSSKMLMFVDGDGTIHEFEWDEDLGALSFLKHGTHGYDEDFSRDVLSTIVSDDVPTKVVDQEDVFEERSRLTDGHWDSAKEWANDGAVFGGGDDA